MVGAQSLFYLLVTGVQVCGPPPKAAGIVSLPLGCNNLQLGVRVELTRVTSWIHQVKYNVDLGAPLWRLAWINTKHSVMHIAGHRRCSANGSYDSPALFLRQNKRFLALWLGTVSMDGWIIVCEHRFRTLTQDALSWVLFLRAPRVLILSSFHGDAESTDSGR